MNRQRSFLPHPAPSTQSLAPTASRGHSPPAPGLVLGGRYLLLQRHGRGGTSLIFRGRDLLAERTGLRSAVAIKILQGIDDEDLALQLVMRELATSRAVVEDGLVRIHDCGRQGRLHYLVMEWLDGETLADLLDRSPDRRLPYRRLAAMLAPIAQTLNALHRRGLVHSDVKPGNIFITSDGEVKLLDLATVRPIPGHPGAGRHGDTGYLGYSPAYASPQTLNDEPATPEDDVYSLACVIYEAVSGGKPYPDGPAVSAGEQVPLPAPPGGLNPVQWRLLRRSLAADAQRRARTPLAMLKSIRLTEGSRLLACSAGSVLLALVWAISSAGGKTDQAWNGSMPPTPPFITSGAEPATHAPAVPGNDV